MAAVSLASCAKQPAAIDGASDAVQVRPRLLSAADAAFNDPSMIATLEMQEPARAIPARWVLEACIGEPETCATADRID